MSIDYILVTGIIVALCDWGHHLLCVSIGVPSRLLPDNWDYCSLCDWGHHLLCVSIGGPSRLLPDHWDYCCFV